MKKFKNGIYHLYSACKPAWCNPIFDSRFAIRNNVVVALSKDHAFNLDFIPEGPITTATEKQIKKGLAGGNGYYYLEIEQEIIIAIGDVHGCIRALKELIDKIKTRYDLNLVKLVFLGDYIDRGESSKQVVQYLIELRTEHPHFVFLMGNHEFELIKGSPLGLDTGESALLEYESEKLSEKHAEFFRFRLSHYFISMNFVFVHGGIPEGYSRAEEVHPSGLVWSYGTAKSYQGKKVICGHAARPEIRESKNSICIDTGCYSSLYGKLTAVVLNDLTGEVVEYSQVINPTLKNSG